MQTASAVRALLSWYRLAGVDEIIQESPPPSLAPPPKAQIDSSSSASQTLSPLSSSSPPTPSSPLSSMPASSPQAARIAQQSAAAATTLDELQQALAAFDECPLKLTAKSCVFCDGFAGADLMVIGEAPGAEEDKQGKPFVGRSGKLLDQMLRALGRDRGQENAQKGVYIANMIPWRPPGNRDPNEHEIEMCMPFIRRHIALANPRVILLVGRVAAQSLLEQTIAVGALREKQWHLPGDDDRKIPTIVTYHPAFLLRQPHQKQRAWKDLRAVQALLNHI